MTATEFLKDFKLLIPLKEELTVANCFFLSNEKASGLFLVWPVDNVVFGFLIIFELALLSDGFFLINTEIYK